MSIKCQFTVYGVLHLWFYNSVFARDVTDLSSAMLDAWFTKFSFDTIRNIITEVI